MSDLLVLDLEVNVVPYKRAGHAGGGHLDAQTAEFRRTFGWLVRAKRPGPPADDEVGIALQIWRECRSTAQRGDIDNLAKAVLDAGNGLLWDDDQQVTRLNVEIFEAGPSVKPRLLLVRAPRTRELVARDRDLIATDPGYPDREPA